MKKHRQYILVSLSLIFLSFLMFLVHYLIFGHLKNTEYYSLMSLCFIPINILAVTLVFEKLVEKNARAERMNKLNMLVGLFFSDLGFTLLKLIVAGDKNINSLDLDYDDLKGCHVKFENYEYNVDFGKIDFVELKRLIVGSKGLLSRLISNENLLEHEIFSDLLMAVMHLRDEIMFLDKKPLNAEDCKHLEGDIIRVYSKLAIQWIDYLGHLKKFYPFQYNSSIKYSPFV